MRKTAIAMLLLLGVAVATVPGAHAADQKIGYVVLPRLIAASKFGQAAEQTLRAKKAEMEKQLDSKLNEVKDFEEDIKKRANVLSEQERKRKGEEYERQARDIKRRQEDLQRSMQRSAAEIEKRVMGQLLKVVDSYGAENKYDLVINHTGALLYAAPGLDITDEVIVEADKVFEAGEGR